MKRNLTTPEPVPVGVAATSIEALSDLLHNRTCTVLTGAGCSTESGIPDYRGPKTRRQTRNPVQYLDFIRKPEMRQRYWARSVVGWSRFDEAKPNAAHDALARLEHQGVVKGLITQNVDRLHHRAGSTDVIELHGTLSEARCLSCHTIEDRDLLQERLLKLNPGWLNHTFELAPDGDAEVDAHRYAAFKIADCQACGGLLKPNVVFFGENVPKQTVARAFKMVDASKALLVVGSSLAVYSGYRFVLHAAKRGISVGLLNLGPPMRGLNETEVFVDGKAGELLPRLVTLLGAS